MYEFAIQVTRMCMSGSLFQCRNYQNKKTLAVVHVAIDDDSKCQDVNNVGDFKMDRSEVNSSGHPS